MKSVSQTQWQRVGTNSNGVTYITPAKMEVDDTIIGRYVDKMIDQRFGGNRYRIETSKGPVVLNGSGQLDFLFDQVEPPTMVRIIYKGKSRIQAGERKGALAHQFEMYVVQSNDNARKEKP